MVEKTVEVVNPTGLNARPVSLFVQASGKFSSDIWVIKDGHKANAKSIMGLISLAVTKGTRIIIQAEGKDEEQAVQELAELISSGFGELNSDSSHIDSEKSND